MSHGLEIKDGQIIGGWRRTVNSAIQVKGSIHDEAVAQKIGIRGGAVAGTNHLDVFVPLLLEAFGPRWFEKGTLSIFYTYMTTDREEVRAVIGLPPPGGQGRPGQRPVGDAKRADCRPGHGFSGRAEGTDLHPIHFHDHLRRRTAGLCQSDSRV